MQTDVLLPWLAGIISFAAFGVWFLARAPQLQKDDLEAWRFVSRVPVLRALYEQLRGEWYVRSLRVTGVICLILSGLLLLALVFVIASRR